MSDPETAESISVGELLPDAFLQKYTGFDSTQAFIDAFAATLPGGEMIEGALDTEAFSVFVRQNTRFDSGAQLLQLAADEMMRRYAGL